MECEELNFTKKGIMTIIITILSLGFVFASLSSYLVDLIVL